jgi:alpha-tubulin suppressor-like RCC1 family protein
MVKAFAVFNALYVLSNDGKVYGYGYNEEGQLGIGSTVSTSTFVPIVMSGVLNGKIAASITAGYSHTVFLSSDGTLFSWGQNGGGQLGK